MSILINSSTRLIVQGITGSQGRFHTDLMQKYGTKIAAGVTPGKGGSDVNGIPVCNTVREAVQTYQANASVIFVLLKVYHNRCRVDLSKMRYRGK